MSQLYRISELVCSNCGGHQIGVIPAEVQGLFECDHCGEMAAVEIADANPDDLADILNAYSEDAE